MVASVRRNGRYDACRIFCSGRVFAAKRRLEDARRYSGGSLSLGDYGQAPGGGGALPPALSLYRVSIGSRRSGMRRAGNVPRLIAKIKPVSAAGGGEKLDAAVAGSRRLGDSENKSVGSILCLAYHSDIIAHLRWLRGAPGGLFNASAQIGGDDVW